MVSEVQIEDRLQMSCKHISLELRPKTSETISTAVYTNEGRLFQRVGHSMRTDEQQC